MKFQANDTIYTKELVFVSGANVVFSPFTAYKVYNTEESNETVIIDNSGLLHLITNVEHLFEYAH